MTNLAENLAATTAAHPDTIALKCDDLEYSYAAFDEVTAKFATHLASIGVEPGDRVRARIAGGSKGPLAVLVEAED